MGEEGKKCLLSLKFVTHSTMMKLGSVVCFLKKTHPLSSADMSNVS